MCESDVVEGRDYGPNHDFEVKLVVVGDGNVGKTSLLMTYIQGAFPSEEGGYTPTVLDNYSMDVDVDGLLSVRVNLWDTAGQEDYDRIRLLSYFNTDVILVCYAVNSPHSLRNVLERWAPELKKCCKQVPKILVGLKMDLRPEATPGSDGSRTVTLEEGESVASLVSADVHLECSAKSHVGVREVFQKAIQRAILPCQNKNRRKKGWRRRSWRSCCTIL